ncbi:MAG: hypothetical protein CBE00_02660 [Planctomycetaceae bacterium TMED240]|nr:hypothetical protein [Rhodopirellula sp.]OUX08083.1 MAG: hypothetical protein CBE00_02660 [Planctomycetaceae bacterium TMED240]
MILNKHAIALGFMTILLVPNANAGEPGWKFLGCPVPDCIGKWCCDDYRVKSPPCVKLPLCFGCDDYCGKSMPRVCAPLCFTCDDYCKKGQPPVCRPPFLSTLRCFPQRGTSACSTCSSGGSDVGNGTGMRLKPSLASLEKVGGRRSAVAGGGDASELNETGDKNPRRHMIIEILNR